MKTVWQTKQQLIDAGIHFEGTELWVKGVRKDRPITKRLWTSKHPYGKDKSYYYYGWNTTDNQGVSISEHRALYIWFKGDIPDGYDIDHIDNNSLNNSLDNLRILTHSENIKRKGISRNKTTAKLNVEEIVKKYDDNVAKRYYRLDRKVGNNYGKQVRHQLALTDKINTFTKLIETEPDRAGYYRECIKDCQKEILMVSKLQKCYSEHGNSFRLVLPRYDIDRIDGVIQDKTYWENRLKEK